MVKTLQESKAQLSELVEAVSCGEDVLISVRGKVRARLTRPPESSTGLIGREWAKDLLALQKRIGARRKPVLTSEQILCESRADRKAPGAALN
jgi:antitoxin (DNA-binding transcriptional repressor) of toxin-antitoxin stability system